MARLILTIKYISNIKKKVEGLLIILKKNIKIIEEESILLIKSEITQVLYASLTTLKDLLFFESLHLFIMYLKTKYKIF